jgi:hypothetical protein
MNVWSGKREWTERGVMKVNRIVYIIRNTTMNGEITSPEK